MNPRIYDFTSFAVDKKTGKVVPTTSQHRQSDYRKCIALGEKLGQKITMSEYREHVAHEERRAQRRERLLTGDWKWLPEFITMIGLNPDKEIFVGAWAWAPVLRVDLVTVQKAWKRAAKKHHPDAGGDAETMTRLSELWSSYETAMQAGTLRCSPLQEPTVTPKKKRKRA